LPEYLGTIFTCYVAFFIQFPVCLFANKLVCICCNWYNLYVSDLASKKCVPCEGGDPPLARDKVEELINKVDGWNLTEDGVCFTWGKMDVTLWTHAVGGLSESDFILAAKIDMLET